MALNQALSIGIDVAGFLLIFVAILEYMTRAFVPRVLLMTVLALVIIGTTSAIWLIPGSWREPFFYGILLAIGLILSDALSRRTADVASPNPTGPRASLIPQDAAHRRTRELRRLLTRCNSILDDLEENQRSRSKTPPTASATESKSDDLTDHNAWVALTGEVKCLSELVKSTTEDDASDEKPQERPRTRPA